MKTAAVLILIISSTAAGVLFSNKAKMKVEICKELLSFCDLLSLDISFRNTPLTDLINKADFKYLDFLTIDNIRKKGRVESVLSDSENSEIADFLYCLGKSDIDNQLKLIEGFKEYVKQLKDKYDAQYIKNSKLYISFGFFGGIVISLLLI